MRETVDIAKLIGEFVIFSISINTMPSYYDPDYLKTVLQAVEELFPILEKETALSKKELARVHSSNKMSAVNLVYYRAIRGRDLSALQNALGFLGISRLARAQRHVKGSLEGIRYILRKLTDDRQAETPVPDLSIQDGMNMLDKNTEQLLGMLSGDRRVRIMVTLPSEASHDYELVKRIVGGATNLVRINCAHDTPDDWKNMIYHVKKAGREFKKEIKIAMDLAGPKIRTGGMDKPLLIKPDDAIYIHKEPFTPDKESEKYHITCSSPVVFDSVKVGEHILFDDGKIMAEITETKSDHFVAKTLVAGIDGKKLKKNKGINLPDSNLDLTGLTKKDKEDLKFVVTHADIVNVSFVNTAQDIKQLIEELKKHHTKEDFGVVLKIETKKAFTNLIDILLHGMRWGPVGVMIARGDLAVETGWANMARLQTEIVNICGAAHVPVIWATQVLESLAKKGTPARSEITDAAASLKAECVMLNKGPHIVETIILLDAMLSNMEAYQSKSSAMSPRLDVSANLV
ncbi:pyruvate kinase [Fulvivirga sp. M361]|uniref:pyruvate kinase n=1 Tax=Fulvivirga sp. M361 TaxID=2594266 RepID=UPI001629DF89|nr:pyruvate kinase [Fulvivirga sp. M361]